MSEPDNIAENRFLTGKTLADKKAATFKLMWQLIFLFFSTPTVGAEPAGLNRNSFNHVIESVEME